MCGVLSQTCKAMRNFGQDMLDWKFAYEKLCARYPNSVISPQRSRFAYHYICVLYFCSNLFPSSSEGSSLRTDFSYCMTSQILHNQPMDGIAHFIKLRASNYGNKRYSFIHVVRVRERREKNSLCGKKYERLVLTRWRVL